MRRKRNRKKIDELNCTESSEIEGRDKNKVKSMESHEKHLSNDKYSPTQFKDTPVQFLYSRNSSSEHDKVTNIDLTSDTDTNDSQMAQMLKTVSTCDLLLECQEESLCPVQQNFYSEEWLKYVKYTATLSQLPSLTAVNGSNVGEKIPSGVSTAQELPILYFTNAGSQPKFVLPPVFSPIMINNPLVTASGTIPISTLKTSNTSPALCNNVATLPMVSKPALVASNASFVASNASFVASNASFVTSNAPLLVTTAAPPLVSVFPVKLEKVTPGPPSETNEEILPLISIDRKIENFIYNTETLNGTTSLSSKETFGNSKLADLLLRNDKNDIPSPAHSNDSGYENSITPELLCRVEVSYGESDNNSTSNMQNEANVSLPVNTDKSAEFNGPKIVDIVSASGGGASVFFQDQNIMPVKVVEFDPASKTKVDSVDKNGTAPSTGVPKVVAQYSIFSMQKTIAVISSGNMEPSDHNMLALRTHIPPPSSERYPGTKLKIKLREQNFLTLSVWWLIEKRYLPLNPPCSSCYGRSFQICSSQQFKDGLCWICEDIDCGKTYAVKRLKFFEQFPHFSLEELLLLTYHWAVKSPVWVILKDVHSCEEKIWEYFAALQQLCGNYIKQHCIFGKSSKHNCTVEASAVKLGKFFILCAFDREESVSRIQALTTDEACNSMKHMEILDEWLNKNCRLITWKKISDQFLSAIPKYAADPTVTDFRSPAFHILNASKYLGKTMVQLFQNICHDKLSIETVQLILDEVQWRERRGKIEEAAFWNIFNEISSLNDSYYYTEAKLGNITSDRYFYKADLSFQMRWGPYNIGEKTSTSYNPSLINDDIREAISNSVSSCTNKLIDSRFATCPPIVIKKVLNETSELRTKHPICIDEQGGAATSNVPKIPEQQPLIKPLDLLSVRIVFNSGDKAQIAAKTEAVNLGKHLRKEGYLSNPVRWLAKKKLIQVEMPCYVCQKKAFLLDNTKFPDGVSWLCQKSHCRFQNRYKRPTFFASFGFRLELLFAIIYHWAVQSDYKTLIKSVPMNELNIISVQRKLQNVCAAVAQKSLFKLGGLNFIVEVALVKFSNCFILGAMERETKLSRLQAYSIQTKLHINNIRKTLVSWLHPETTVVVNSNKYLGSYSMDEKINLVFADKAITNVHSKKYHTLTISNYLQNHMRNMFGNFNTQSMSAEILQVYLDELVWRERYGGTPTHAFNNIMQHIFTAYEPENNVESADVTEESLIRDATLHYNLPSPLPKAVVFLEKLPEDMIERYTSAVTNKVPETQAPDSKAPATQASDSKAPATQASDSKAPVTQVPDSKAPATQAPDSKAPATQSPKTQVSSAKARHTEKPAFNIKIKEEVISDDDEVQILDYDKSSVKASTSSSKSTSPASNSVKVPSFKIYYDSSKLSVKKSERHYSRYSNKCYSSKRKAEDNEFLASKFQCIECKNLVSYDHFKKMYSCTDCKYYQYSTFCQKAFAQHRSYVLFGRKMTSNTSECSGFHHKVSLSDPWYCLCGFTAEDGNELASHLVSCNHDTCCMHIDVDVSEPHVL